MNGSRQSIYLALGCVAALTASACSRPSQSPSSPSLGQDTGTSPRGGQSPETTGGSNAQQPGLGSDTGSQGTGQPGGMGQGEQSDARGGGSMGMGQQGSGAGQQGSGAGQQGSGAGQQGTGTGGGQLGAQGGQAGSPGTMGGTNETPTAIDEREACDRLTSEATLRTEQIEGGVSIVARPRRGTDLSTLRSSMQSVQRGIERGAPSSATAQCDLFALGRTGVVAITETPDSIRLLVTSSDASRVPQLRRQANEFIRSRAAGGSSGQQNGGTRGGTQKGGTPRGGGAQDRNGSGSQQGGGTHGGGTPQHGGGTPQHGGGTPDQGGTTPQPGGTTPQGGTP